MDTVPRRNRCAGPSCDGCLFTRRPTRFRNIIRRNDDCRPHPQYSVGMRTRYRLVVAGGVAIAIGAAAVAVLYATQSPKLSVRNDLSLTVVLNCAGDLSSAATPGKLISAAMVWAPSATACLVYSVPGPKYLGCFLFDGDPGSETVELRSRLSNIPASDCTS